MSIQYTGRIHNAPIHAGVALLLLFGLRSAAPFNPSLRKGRVNSIFGAEIRLVFFEFVDLCSSSGLNCSLDQLGLHVEGF